MKQYDKIFVPSESPHPVEARGISGRQYKPISNAIVMTRNEAFDLWMAAIDFCDTNIRPEDRKDFATYLTSKGIKL